MTLPPYQTASGVSDIFAHCLERYFSDTPDCELTDRMLEAVMLTMLKEGRRVMKNPNDYEHPEVTAMEGVKLLRAFFDELGMPNSISSLGGKPEDISGMVENMFYGAPNHGSFIKLTPEIAAEIYSMAM